MRATQEELEALLRANEADRIELTTSTNKTDKFCEAICAFANDLPGHRKPGYLFIGAKEDGTAAGVPITDELLQKLGDLRSNGTILPPPAMSIEKRSLGGGEMAVVEVLPSDMPPVRYKGQVWIRVGPRRATANESEERILSERRAALARTWDARPCYEAELDSLVLDLFTTTYRTAAVARQVLEENHRPLEAQLAALRFYDLRAGRPTNAGVLLFAEDSLRFFPGAYVQYVKYEGTAQDSRVLLERRYSGDLRAIMRGLDDLARDLAEERPEPAADGMTDRIVASYPRRALHELFMNAIIHRNYESTTPVMLNHYSDKLELLNPGGLYGDLTPDQFPRVTAYRNPVLAEAAKVLGFANRFGRGIDLAQSELWRNGSRLAEFDLRANHVLVTVWRRP